MDKEQALHKVVIAKLQQALRESRDYEKSLQKRLHNKPDSKHLKQELKAQRRCTKVIEQATLKELGRGFGKF
jgi:hypothetical protein